MNNKWDLSDFRPFVEDILKQWQVPGVAIAIVQNNQTILCEGFGLRNVDQNLPVTPETVFSIASCTKAFTAMTLGLLVDEGKLDWDRPIREILPSFQLQDKWATEQMTARDLLTHRSGLPRHDLLWYASNFDRRDVFRRLRYLEPSRSFRSTFQYQNMMYMVAGILVEEITGMSWEKFVQTRIFEPLGMNHSNLSTEVTQKLANFASPYIYQKEQLKKIPFFKADGENDAVGPAGNINSCVQDMVLWLNLHLNGGKFQEQPFILAETLEQMHTPHIFESPTKNQLGQEFISYGLGWSPCSHKGKVLIQHGGAIDGFASLVSFMPHDHLGVIVLSNGDVSHNPIPALITYTIYDRLLNLEPTDWNRIFTSKQQEREEAKKRSQEKAVVEQKKDAPPSHSIESYLGDYEHPGYGIVSIAMVDEQLEMVMNDKLTLPIVHCYYDIFEANFVQLDEKFKFSFSTDLKGNIASLTTQVEPAVKDIVFTRKPDRKLTEKSFLQQFVGIYELESGNSSLTIALKNETLTATFQGQRENVLVPDRGTEFNLQGQPGVSIEFKSDENGQFTEALCILPSAVFVAKKRA